jgi:hypothetical protein
MSSFQNKLPARERRVTQHRLLANTEQQQLLQVLHKLSELSDTAGAAPDILLKPPSLTITCERDHPTWAAAIAKVAAATGCKHEVAPIVLLEFDITAKDAPGRKVRHYLDSTKNSALLGYSTTDSLLQISVLDQGSSFMEFATVLETLLTSDYFSSDPSHDQPSNQDVKIEPADFTPAAWWSAESQHLVKLVREHKNAPLYVYSLKRLRENIQQLKSIQSIDRVFYAMKANFNEHVLRAVHDSGLSLEVVSKEEVPSLLR